MAKSRMEMPEDIRRMAAEMMKAYDNRDTRPQLRRGKDPVVDTSKGARLTAKKPVRLTLATALGADNDPMETAKEGYRAVANGEAEDPILSPGAARAVGAGLAAYQGLETAGGVSGAGATQYIKGSSGVVRPRLAGYDDMATVTKGTSGIHLLHKNGERDEGASRSKRKPSAKTLRNAMLGLDALEITSKNGKTGSTITSPYDGKFIAATRYKALVSFLSNPKSVVNDAIIKRVMDLPGSHNVKAALVGRPDFPIDRYLTRIMNSGDFLVQKAVALREDLPRSVLSKVKESDAADLSGFAAGLAERKDLSEDGMRLLMTHRSPAVRGAVAGRSDLPEDLVEAAFRDEAPGVRYRAIMSGRVPDAILKEAFYDRDPLITATMARRPDAPPELFQRLLSTPPGDKYHEANVISALRNPRTRPADIMEWLRTSLDSPVWKLGAKDAYKNRILIDTLSKRGDLNMARVLSTMLLGTSPERAAGGATNPYFLENSNARDAARNYLKVNAERAEKDMDRPESKLSDAMRRRAELFSSLANPANWFGKDGVRLDQVGLSKYASFLSDLAEAGVAPALTDVIPGSGVLNGTNFRDIQYFPSIVTKSPFLQREDAIRMTEDALRETRELMGYFGIPDYSAPNKLSMVRDMSASSLVRPEFVPDSGDRPFLMWAHPAIGKTKFANGVTYVDFDRIKGDRLPQMLGPAYQSGFEGRQAFRKKYPGVLEDATSRLLDEVIADPAYRGAVVMMSDKSILRDRYGDLDVIINTPRDVFLRHEAGRGAEASRDPEVWKSDLDPLIDAARGSGKVIDTGDYLSDFFARPDAMDRLAAAGAAGRIEDRGSFGHALAPSGAPLPPDYLYGFHSSFAGGNRPVRWFLDPARVYEDPRVSAYASDAYTADANEFVRGGHNGLGAASLEDVDAAMRKNDSKGHAAIVEYNSIGGADWETRHKLATALDRLFDMRRLVSEIEEGNRNLVAVHPSPYYRSVYRPEIQDSNLSAGEIKLRVPSEDLVNWSKAVLVPDGVLAPGSAKGDYFRRTYPHVRIETYSGRDDFLDKSGALGYEYSQAAKGGDTSESVRAAGSAGGSVQGKRESTAPTDEQLREAAAFLRLVVEKGFAKTDDEIEKCERLARAIEAAVGAEPVKPKGAPLEARPLRPTAETQAAIDAGEADEDKDLFGRNGTVETTAQDVEDFKADADKDLFGRNGTVETTAQDAEDFKSNADRAAAQPAAPGQEQPAQQVAVQPRQEQPARQAAVQPRQEQLAPGLARSGSRSNILEFNGRRISQREFDRIQAKFLEGGVAQQPQAARPVQQPQVAANDADDALKPNKLRQTTQVDSGRKDALGRPLDEYGRVIA